MEPTSAGQFRGKRHPPHLPLRRQAQRRVRRKPLGSSNALQRNRISARPSVTPSANNTVRKEPQHASRSALLVLPQRRKRVRPPGSKNGGRRGKKRPARGLRRRSPARARPRPLHPSARCASSSVRMRRCRPRLPHRAPRNRRGQRRRDTSTGVRTRASSKLEGARAGLDQAARARRPRRYSITPGMIEIRTIPMITSDRLLRTNGRLPKK